MKIKAFSVFLAAEAAALTVLGLLPELGTNLLSSVFAFPFEPLAAALSALALTGRLGSGFAFALMAAASLALPAAFCFAEKGQGKSAEKLLDVFLAVFTALSLWLMADEARLLSLCRLQSAEILPAVKSCIGLAVWSLVLCRGIMLVLRLFKAGDMEKLMAYGEILLYALAALFTAAAALDCPAALASALKFRETAADAVFAAAHFAVSLLPYVFDVIICLSALRFLRARKEKAENIAYAENTAALCVRALTAVSLSAAGINILQIVFMKHLSHVNINVEIPVTSLAFTLAVLLVSRLMAENKRLAEDNELFI